MQSLNLEVDNEHELPTMSGFLSKEGHFFRSWKQRWFVLDQQALKYYEPKERTFKGVIPLAGFVCTLKISRRSRGASQALTLVLLRL